MIFLTGPQTSGALLECRQTHFCIIYTLLSGAELFGGAPSEQSAGGPRRDSFSGIWMVSRMVRMICVPSLFQLSYALFFGGGLLCLHICIHIVYKHTHTELQYIPQLYIYINNIIYNI